MVTINQRDRIDWRPGLTVRDLLEAMGYHYRLITVTVNGEVVEHEAYDHHEVPDEAEVTVFHLAHGG